MTLSPPSSSASYPPSTLSRLHNFNFTLTESLILLRYAMAAITVPAVAPIKAWAFDVSALMVLIGEQEELRYRLAGRSLAECFVAAPVAGIQSYLRSYEILLDQSPTKYFSPYGCNSAPLRNMKLDNAIRQKGLLKDGLYNL